MAKKSNKVKVVSKGKSSLISKDVPGGTGIDEEDTSTTENITEPFDPATIRIETAQQSIDTLLTRIREDEIDLAPGFQRKGGVWNDNAQSRLIESLIIRIPLPAFYMDATNEDKWLVVDGLQRLTTLKRFVITKELTLSGLEFLKSLEGLSFTELPRAFQRRILETQVTVYRIEKGTSPEVKFNIFKRINTGGLPLSAQEIRHALHQGKVTEFLEKLASSEEFKKATDNSIRDDRMADRECVLRFLAFNMTPPETYTSKNFDYFLNEAMAKLNTLPERNLSALRQDFLRAMNCAYDLFGREAFRKRYREDATRLPINKALFEAWSVKLSKLKSNELIKLSQRKDKLMREFIKKMTDQSFVSSISLGTGDAKKVKQRFSSIEEVIKVTLK